MQNLYKLFCVMIFTFPQNYYIQQLLTIDHDYQLPDDNHGSVKILPHPFDPPKGSKVKYLIFLITKTVVNFFAEIMHAGRAAIDMKHIKWDFSLKAWVRSPGVDLGVRPKLNFFGIWSCCISN